MDRNKVIELLVKSGLIEPDYIHRCSVISEFEQFAKMVEQEALEKAANICEANARELVFDDHAQGCRDCAYDIRNLKNNS